MFRSKSQFCAFVLLLAAGCGPGRMSIYKAGTCSKSSQSALHGLSLVENATPSPLGGLLQIQAVKEVPGAPDSLTAGAFDKVQFSRPKTCSAAMEFRKLGSAYFADVFTSEGCFVVNLVRLGSSPELMVYRPAIGGRTAGYESIGVQLPLLVQRDKALKALDAFSGSQADQKNRFFLYLWDLEQIVTLRERASVAAQEEASQIELGRALCLAVPQAELDAYDALPEASQGLHPSQSSNLRPGSCQSVVDGTWQTFEVPENVAAQKSALLDQLVAETTLWKSASDASLNVLNPPAELRDFRRLSREWVDSQRKLGALQLARAAIRGANGGCPHSNPVSAAENKLFAGPQRDAYFNLIREFLDPADRAIVDELRAYQCGADDPKYAKFQNERLFVEWDKADAKGLELAKALRKIQAFMKANQAHVGIATNHIRNTSVQDFSVAFRELKIFPGTAPLAEELSRHTFSFSNEWIDMNFDVTKANPKINNLRHEWNSGYALTFAGEPIGALAAKLDESGGVAAIPLPVPQAASSAGKPDASPAPDQNSDTGKGNRETTIRGDAPAEGC